MTANVVKEGFDVFVHDGEKAIGAVRKVQSHALVIYVENAGDFSVPLTAIQNVDEDKVVLNCGKLEVHLKRAIGHAHQGEDPTI
jgi:hypothetical protein